MVGELSQYDFVVFEAFVVKARGRRHGQRDAGSDTSSDAKLTTQNSDTTRNSDLTP
jgi:hypothetical protein